MTSDPSGDAPRDTLPPSSNEPASPGDAPPPDETSAPPASRPSDPATAAPEPDDEPADDVDGESEGDVEQARELSRAHLQGLLEALVFASDKPMKDREIARLASAPVKQVRELLAELRPQYQNRGIVLDEVAGGWLFRTNVQYAPFVRELSAEKPVRLTRAQVETLAIAAYRQPVTRPEIDDIRGVDSGATLKLLLDRDLVRILGKKDEPGRPLLYGTTTQFLEFFGLKSLKDLPTLKEFTELTEESRLVAEAELGEVMPQTAEATAPRDTIAPGPPHEAGPEDAGPEQAESPEAEPGDTVPPPAPATHEDLDGSSGVP